MAVDGSFRTQKPIVNNKGWDVCLVFASALRASGCDTDKNTLEEAAKGDARPKKIPAKF